MRISDWSSDVCSSDLSLPTPHGEQELREFQERQQGMQRLLPTPHGEQERVAVAKGAARRSLPTPHVEQELRRRQRCILVANPSNPSSGTTTNHDNRDNLRVRVLPTPKCEQDPSSEKKRHRETAWSRPGILREK